MLRIQGWPIGRGPRDAVDEDSKGHTKDVDCHSTGHSNGRDTNAPPDWGWGATVDLRKKASSKPGEPAMYEVSVLVMCNKLKTRPEDGGDKSRNGEVQEVIPTPMLNGIQVVFRQSIQSIGRLYSPATDCSLYNCIILN